MQIKSKKILKRLSEQKPDKKRISIYLSEATYITFREVCGQVSPSEVLEELMELFIEGTSHPEGDDDQD